MSHSHENGVPITPVNNTPVCNTTRHNSPIHPSSSLSPPSILTVESDSTRNLHCCWNACHVRIGTVIVSLFEILLLFHALIFLAVNVANGEKKYKSYASEFAPVIKYEYFVPMIVLQSLWIFGDIAAVLAVKYVSPGLMILQSALRTPPLLAGVIMAIIFIVNASRARWIQTQPSSWALVLTLTIFVICTVISVYFTYVMWMCSRYLRHCRRIISAQQIWTETTTVASIRSKEAPDRLEIRHTKQHRQRIFSNSVKEVRPMDRPKLDKEILT